MSLKNYSLFIFNFLHKFRKVIIRGQNQKPLKMLNNHINYFFYHPAMHVSSQMTGSTASMAAYSASKQEFQKSMTRTFTQQKQPQPFANIGNRMRSDNSGKNRKNKNERNSAHCIKNCAPTARSQQRSFAFGINQRNSL